MKICENGVIRDMTTEELAAMQDAAAQAKAEEKRRPLSFSEVQEMLVRQQINTLTVDDQTALRMAAFYPEWVDLAAEQYSTDKAGFRFTHDGNLYKTIPDVHTFGTQWVPGMGTESIYVRIDEAHDGTKYDPIPAARGMEYVYGLYYADGEDGKLYLCQRTGESAGGTVILYYMPHELEGSYFERVEA